MFAYYNENDPKKVAWLRELIKQGHIAPGDVDERSIKDVRPDDLQNYIQCHFFAGIGIWSHALRAAGWADTREVWTGSCPCQSFSQAGKQRGFDDPRHLWPEWFRLIRERRPSVVFGEQSASKDALAWLDLVQVNLADAGYTSGAVDICAASVGAPHIRQRLYFVGPTPMAGTPAQKGYNEAGNTDSSRKTQALITAVEDPARLTASGEMLTGSSAETSAGGQLNPEHFRWLMGIPSAWDSCGVMAMQSLPRLRKRLSKVISK